MACIPIKTAQKLKKALQDGNLSVDELLTKTSDEREALLLKYIDEKETKSVNDFIIKKYKTELSEDMVEEIFSRTDKINKLRDGMPEMTIKQWNEMKDIPEWAKDYVALNNKIENILNPTNDMGFWKTVGYIGKETKESIKGKATIGGKALEVGKMAGEVLTSAVYKSIKASFDMSYALRQGFKVMTKDVTDKTIAMINGKPVPISNWKKSFNESWNVWKNIGNKEKMGAVMNEWKARYFTHPHYDMLVNDGKLAFGSIEDFFPTTLVQKLGYGVGNIFKASDEAFTIFSQSARFGLASDMVEKQLAGRIGSGLTKEEVRGIAQFANSITGRGSLGKWEANSGFLNKLFFSARFIRSQADTFIMPFNQTVSPFVREEARNHSIATFGTVGAMIATASMFGEVELDPRSSNFGKLSIGDNTKIDLTAGLGSYIVLATKQALSETKNASSGKISKLNTGVYGSQTRGDVLSQWATNKLAPAPGAINTLVLRGRDFKGDKPKVGSIATSLGVPISLENMVELLQDEEGAIIVAAWVADVLGMSSQTFKK